MTRVFLMLNNNQISLIRPARARRLTLKSEFYGDGGLYGQTYGRRRRAQGPGRTTCRRSARRWIDLGGIPQFCARWPHYGGLRIVGRKRPRAGNIRRGKPNLIMRGKRGTCCPELQAIPAQAEDLRRPPARRWFKIPSAPATVARKA